MGSLSRWYRNLRIVGITILLPVLATQSFASDVTWYKDPDLKISFAYDNKWQPVQAAESNTRHVVNWRGKKGGLVATCYLQAIQGTELAKSTVENLHDKSEIISKSLMNNMSLRYRNIKLIKQEKTFVDGYPVLSLVREGDTQNLDETYQLKTWILFTVWKDHEVSFECASDIPRRFPEIAPQVEQQIQKVIKTLHFER